MSEDTDYEKCGGYKLSTETIYLDFPFQVFDLKGYGSEFVFENGVFHAAACENLNYRATNGNCATKEKERIL